jgi:putative copper resistance protein D
VPAAAWEGSVAGIAYSEFNHHVAGWLLLLIALAELGLVLRPGVPRSIVLLLPGALGATGIFLLVWSDHEAWPIGHMTLSETLFGGDQEILQHKLYGVLALTIASIEVLRRFGLVTHAAWLFPLPAFAIIGGWMLFSHSHGAHPSAHKIALHHAIMGTLAVTAGSSKLVGAWKNGRSLPVSSRWELLWAGLILLIGLQLIFYSE